MTAGPFGGDLGLTVRWAPATDLTLSAAGNPDFSQVEADTAQLKINTRFALYYPEKRPLFLEGADFFQTRLNTIYTRTVADPSWGARMVGKTGHNALGVFVAQDRITNLLFPANQESRSTTLDQDSTSGALRYRRDVGASSTLGALYTDRQGSGYSNRVLGLDGMIRMSERDTLNAQALVSRTEYPAGVATDFLQPDGPFRGKGLSVGYQHESKEWVWGLSGSDLGTDLRVDTGFIPRVDTRSTGASLERVVWGDPGSALIRMSFGASGYRTENHDGLLTDATDGLLARRLNQTSELGAKLDSWADLFTYLCLPFCAWWLRPEVIRQEAVYIGGGIFFYLAAIAVGFWKFHHLTSYHTWGAKISAVVFGAAVLVLFAGGPGWVFRWVMPIIVLAELEEMAITATLPELRANVRSLWHALKIRRTLQGVPHSFRSAQ